jgi:hypothetical protein
MDSNSVWLTPSLCVANHVAYFSAAVPEPHTILGLRLRPFSLGHRILLKRIGNAFLSPEGRASEAPVKITYDDLASAVFICAHTWKENLEALHDLDGTQKFMRAWQRKLSGQTGWKYWLGLRAPALIDLPGKAKAFSAYLADGESHPSYHFEPGGEMDCPIEQIVKATLLSQTSLTEDEIMDRSWSLCLWDYLTLKAINGDINFIDDDEIEELIKAGIEFNRRLKAGSPESLCPQPPANPS